MTAQMSEGLEKLATALAAAQKEMKAATKDKEVNTAKFAYKYADLDSCWEVARGPLTSNGLSVTQWPSAQGCLVTVETILLHISGQWIKNTLTLKASGDTPQPVGSAITYARRYGFSAAVGITSDADDDGAAAMPQIKSQPPRIEIPPHVHYFDKNETSMLNNMENWLKERKAFGSFVPMCEAMHGKPCTDKILNEELRKIIAEG